MTGELFLQHSVNKLTQMNGYIEACVLKLNADQVWSRAHGPQNSVGNLILHLCGNVRQWIGSSVGGQADVRDRDREFSPSSRIDMAELLAKLDATVEDAVAILKDLPPSRLSDR